jgi:hypothetical protein
MFVGMTGDLILALPGTCGPHFRDFMQCRRRMKARRVGGKSRREGRVGRGRPAVDLGCEEVAMTIVYLHASRFGNGALVAEEFERLMAAKGVTVEVQHIRDARTKELPLADLFVFSSPGRMGKPKGEMRRFLKKLNLPAGTMYAILTTEMAPQPDKRTGRMPTEDEIARWQRVIPIMNELLRAKGLVRVAEGKVYVIGLKGPLEEGWQKKVEDFAAQIPVGTLTE